MQRFILFFIGFFYFLFFFNCFFSIVFSDEKNHFNESKMIAIMTKGEVLPESGMSGMSGPGGEVEL